MALKWLEVELLSITEIHTLGQFGFKPDLMVHGNGLVSEEHVVQLFLKQLKQDAEGNADLQQKYSDLDSKYKTQQKLLKQCKFVLLKEKILIKNTRLAL